MASQKEDTLTFLNAVFDADVRTEFPFADSALFDAARRDIEGGMSRCAVYLNLRDHSVAKARAAP